MQIVAGISLKGLNPRVWDPQSPYHLPQLQAVMISYADFIKMPARRQKAMEQGLHQYLGVPKNVSIYLDNGAFYFLRSGGEVDWDEYKAFVARARPDWYPIPQDYIPTPKMTDKEQRECLERTMKVNRAFSEDGYIPVIHISRCLDKYLCELQGDQTLSAKPHVALGGIVPNLLRAPKAMAYSKVLDSLHRTRTELEDKHLHVFGLGGTATLHLAALLGINSLDSSGWRNRAARGIIQLPGRGERIVAELGNWRGRRPNEEEWKLLAECECPSCRKYGVDGLKENGLSGFCNRATHNLWILLEEARLIQEHLEAGDYSDWYMEHVENSIYLPLIEQAARLSLLMTGA